MYTIIVYSVCTVLCDNASLFTDSLVAKQMCDVMPVIVKCDNIFKKKIFPIHLIYLCILYKYIYICIFNLYFLMSLDRTWQIMILPLPHYIWSIHWFKCVTLVYRIIKILQTIWIIIFIGEFYNMRKFYFFIQNTFLKGYVLKIYL